MDSIIKLVPDFKGKIWGGRRMASDFGYDIPDGPVGECWAISAHPNGDDVIAVGMSADEGGTIVVGQNARSREEFAQMVEEGRWDELLNVIPIHAGDFFQIDPGCVHAIKGGTVILETQQSSDVTYRVYDYDRPGDDGKLRPLHLEQSLDVIDYAMDAPESGEITAPEVDGVTVLVSNDCYTVERLRVDGELKFATPFPFTCVSVIEGDGSINGEPVVKGSHLLALSACDELVLTGDMTIITSHL